MNLNQRRGLPTGDQLKRWNPDRTRRVILLGLRGLHNPTQLTGVLAIEGRLEGFLPIGLHRSSHQHRGPGH